MGTLKVNGAISATGTISATNGFAGNLDWSYITNEPNFALKRNNNGFYVGLGSCYTAGTHPTYYRIILPDVQLNAYGMYTIDILVNQSYSSGYGGKIIIEAYHGASEMEWASFKAHVSGTLTSDIKVYGSDGKYFYIGGCSAWGNIAIENMITSDTAWYSDLSGTTIDYVNSLPSTYQTAEMHYGLTSQNYSSYCAPASHTHRYLPLDGGGTMTGSISYQTANHTSTPLYVLDDGTSYGHTLIIGAGGSTFIGGGESAADLYNATGWKSGENIYMAATEISFFTNCDDISHRISAMTIDANGHVSMAKNLYLNGSAIITGSIILSSDIVFSDKGDLGVGRRIHWSGSTDAADIYYRLDAADAGRLVFNLQDDANTLFCFAYNGTDIATINTSGYFTGSASYATGSDYTFRLTGRSVTDNITTAPPTGSMVYDYNVLDGTAGLFPVWHNGNSILTLNKHAGNYDSQLGFSSNGRIYYRNFSGSALDSTTGWNTIAFTSDTVAGADTVDGYHASSLFKIGPWWYSGNSHNANDLVNSTVFAYTSHNVPYVGTLIDFSNSENANYRFQINAAYNNENVAFRSRNGDNGTWREWTSFITSANYTSYCAPASHSHSYASLASPNNLLFAGNEFTFVPGGYSGSIWFNYRAGWNTGDGNITEYNFGNGKGGLAPAAAQYFRTANYGSGVPGTGTPGYGNTGAIYYKI